MNSNFNNPNTPNENIALESYGYVEIDIDTEGCEVTLKVMVEGDYCHNAKDWDISEVHSPDTKDGRQIKAMVYNFLCDKENHANIEKQFEKNATKR